MTGGSTAPSENTGSWLCTLLLPPASPNPTPRCSSALPPLLLRVQLGVAGWELCPRWLCRLGRLAGCAPDRDWHRGLCPSAPWVSSALRPTPGSISAAGIGKVKTLPWLSRRLALGPYARRDWEPRESKTERTA